MDPGYSGVSGVVAMWQWGKVGGWGWGKIILKGRVQHAALCADPYELMTIEGVRRMIAGIIQTAHFHLYKLSPFLQCKPWWEGGLHSIDVYQISHYYAFF
jgi:hypothetical protein